MEILRRSGPPNHYHELPGWLERRRLGLTVGAVIRCSCGILYRFEDDPDLLGGSWMRLYDDAEFANLLTAGEAPPRSEQ